MTILRRRSVIALLCLFLVFFTATFFTGTTNDQPTLALVGATVYASPGAEPLRDSVVLIAEGRIQAVEKRTTATIPKGARIIDCTGKTIVAGFWNSHVHFMETTWKNAGTRKAAELEKLMQQMLTRWGFTTVWDLGSDPGTSFALRRRVESGEVPGPKIFLAADIFPKNGHPAYLPPEMQLPVAATAVEAEQMSRDDLKMGYDGMKLFTGVYMGDRPVINMDTAMVKAAVDVAHAQGKPVFAHPQNRVGLENAINGGVDILAHTIPATDFLYTSEELARCKVQHTALIPTLTLWTTIFNDPAVTTPIVQAGAEQLKAFFMNGGTVLFGTDVGFISIFDTSFEMEFMGHALAPKEVLASLTTNPASYFHASTKGRVEKGLDADLVVLDGDPMNDVRNLAKVAYTIRAGLVIFQR